MFHHSRRLGENGELSRTLSSAFSF